MSIATTAPSTVQIRRSRLLWLIVGVAAVAAASTWALTTLAGGSEHDAAKSASARISLTSSQKHSLGSIASLGAGYLSRSSDAPTPRVPSIFELTPARLAAGALGTGYQLPVKLTGPTLESVLASMSAQTRRWTKAVTGLTFEQLADGAAGYP